MSFYVSATPPLRFTRDSERLVEPVVHPPKCKPRRSHLAVSAGALIVRKMHQRPRASQVVVELLWLALEEHIALRVAHEGRTRDFFCHSVAQMKLERRRQICPRSLRTHAVRAMRHSPRRRRRLLHRRFERFVHLRRVLRLNRRDYLIPLLGRNRA